MSVSWYLTGQFFKKHITIGNIYIPPTFNNTDIVLSTFINELAPILSKLGKESSETITVGDVNFDLLKVNDRQRIGNYFYLFCTNGFTQRLLYRLAFLLIIVHLSIRYT